MNYLVVEPNGNYTVKLNQDQINTTLAELGNLSMIFHQM
jgi:hypothetical protein